MIRLLVFAVSIVVSGCAAFQSDQASLPVTFEQNRARVSALDHWDIRARVSFREGSKAEIGRLNWQRHGDVHNLQIYGGLGSRHIRVRQDSSGAVLENTEGERIAGDNVEEVLERNTGWSLPIRELTSWIIGLPDVDIASEGKSNADGYFASIKQSEWTVLISRYRTFDNYVLPTRLRLIADNPTVSVLDPDKTALSGDTELRFAISSWEVN